MGCMIGVVFVFVTLLAWLPQDISACSCFPTHPQTVFCQNSFGSSRGENTIRICNTLIPRTFENWVYLLTRGRNSYIRNCRCKVLEEGDASTPRSCKLSNSSKECYRKTAICRRAQGGTCEWKNDEQCS